MNVFKNLNEFIAFAIAGIISFAIFLVLLSMLPSSPAAIEDIHNLIAISEKSPKAKEFLVNALKKTPNPDVNRLDYLKENINKILVLETSKEFTGN